MTFKKRNTEKEDALNKLIAEQKEETADQRFRDNPPSKFIQDVMKGKSKVEMLDADVNWNRFMRLAERVSERIDREKIEKELTETKEPEVEQKQQVPIVKLQKKFPQPVHNNPIQDSLF